jgi:4-amino-4-deoxy-L-arabinose transferase-like glycosyltransferase
MNSSASIRQMPGFSEFLRRHAEALRVAGLVAVALFLYLFELGKGALPDWDEAIYAEVTKEMIRGHHWLTPYWNHHPFFEKPPLLYWSQMVTFRLFGINEFAARLPSALAGVGTLLLVYATVRQMAGKTAALFAALVLLSTRYFYHWSREGTTDALLCFCIYLTVYGYVRMQEGDGRWFYLLCAGLGLGILAKGPAEFVAPMAIGLDWLIRGRKKLVSRREFWLGVAVLAVIALPWHIWMMSKFGWHYINEYLGYQILTRAERGIEGNTGGLLYYFPVIWKGTMVWCLVGIWALVRFVWKREWEYSLPWLLMGVTLGLYTAVETKLIWYVVPLYPALAMEVGRLLAEWKRRWRIIGYGFFVGVVAFIGVAVWRRVHWPGSPIANAERHLALVAKEKAGPGPLVVVGMPYRYPALDIRTALFYSSRDVVWQQLPEHLKKLEAALKEYPQVDVMMEESTAQTLGRTYVVEPVAEVGKTILARVSRKP